MKDLFLQFWYVPAVFSAIYTIASAWWTVAAERRFRWLRQELRIQELTYAKLHTEIENMHGYLERDETLRKVRILPFPKKKRSS